MNNTYKEKMDCVRLSEAGKRQLIGKLTEVEEKDRARPKRVLRIGVLVAVIAGVFLITAGAVSIILPVLQNYFGESAPYVYQKNSQILNRSQTVDGWTLTLTDCVGDDNFFYMGMELMAPEGTILDEIGAGGVGMVGKDMEKGFSPGYNFKQCQVIGEDGIAIFGYINQVPDEDGADNKLRFVLWGECDTSLLGQNITLDIGELRHDVFAKTAAEFDFAGSWHFDAIKLDWADQTIRLKPNLSVPVLDTTAMLTEVTVSPISVMVYFEGEGLIGQQQRYPNSYNIADPKITLYDKKSNMMQEESGRAPFGIRTCSSADNNTGKLRIVLSYETFIDLEQLGSIEVCGVQVLMP